MFSSVDRNGSIQIDSCVPFGRGMRPNRCFAGLSRLEIVSVPWATRRWRYCEINWCHRALDHTETGQFWSNGQPNIPDGTIILCTQRGGDCKVGKLFLSYSQRYLQNKRYFKSGGPIFLVAGGEWEILARTISPGQHVVAMAKEFNALILYSEHRYYGKSRPTKYVVSYSASALHDLLPK